MNCIRFQRLAVMVLTVTTTGFAKAGMEVQGSRTSRTAPTSVDDSASEDLDAETAAHSEREGVAQTRPGETQFLEESLPKEAVETEHNESAQTITEEVEFVNDLLDKLDQLG